MKKSIFLLMIAIMSLTLVPNIASASPTDPVTTTNNDPAAARAQVLLNRLNEIKDMDKSSLTRTEKRALRKEVKGIRSELAATGSNGIYLSVGAIIIIILLLILIL